MTDQPTVYDYSPITERPPLRWPQGAGLAVYVGLNVEHYRPGEPGLDILPDTANRPVDPINVGWRDYGPRVGLWRLADLLDEVGIRPSVLLNSDVCEAYPQIIEAGQRRGWSWVAHGENNSMFAGDQPPRLSRAGERRHLADMTATITAATGVQPRGWLGPLGLEESGHTLDLLGELGYRYVLDYMSDEQPVPLRRGGLLSVPYSFEINDAPLFVHNGASGPEFAQRIIDQFDVLHDEAPDTARVMCIALHPFIAGQPFRARHLRRALEHIVAHSDIWLTTSDEIADWYLELTREHGATVPSSVHSG